MDLFDSEVWLAQNEGTMTVKELLAQTAQTPKTSRMPALFIGHGSPMHGIEDTSYAKMWAHIGKTLPTPSAILVISAHWLTEGTYVHVSEHPRTIHDFFGFPEELYTLNYPAPGSPEFAQATKTLITDTTVSEDRQWGLDHGAWIVLRRMYPNANIPTFQLSIDMTKSGAFHYELGKELRALRNRGVLIIASGNIVHNLRLVNFHHNAPGLAWAERFDLVVAEKISVHDHDPLIAYDTLGPDATLSIPTPDHYFPLLYLLGLQEDGDNVSFPTEGIDLGSISMRSVLLESTPK